MKPSKMFAKQSKHVQKFETKTNMKFCKIVFDGKQLKHITLQLKMFVVFLGKNVAIKI
jgi:hypothetical protein